MKKLNLAVILLLCLFNSCSPSYYFNEEKTISEEILTNKTIKDKIKQDTKNMSVEQIINYCEDLTCSYLDFSFTSSFKSVNTLKSNTKTHCVYFATTCSSFLNYAFKVNNFENISKHCRSDVGFFGKTLFSFIINKTKYKNFFKDHDYCAIYLPNEDAYIIIDPSVYDVFHMRIRDRFEPYEIDNAF